MDFIFLAVGITSSKGFSGGSGTIIEWGNGLLAKGHTLVVLTSRAGERNLTDLGLGGADYWLIDLRDEVTFPNLMSLSLEMIIRMFKAGLLLRRRSLREGTVILAPSEFLTDVFPLLFVNRDAAIRVVTFHMPYFQPFKGYKGAFTGHWQLPVPRDTLAYFQHRLSLLCMRRSSDVVLAPSNLLPYVLGRGIPPERIVPWSPGIDLDRIDPVPASAEKYDACWIGRYHPMKGCEDLIRAWSIVSRTRGRARLAIMGDVIERLKPLVRKARLEGNVELLGPVDDRTKFQVMKGSQLFLLPSYFEHWAQVAREAMACGLPVVAYDLPVFRDTYTKGMVTVAIGDGAALARAVIGLLGNQGERKKLAQGAREMALKSRRGWDESLARLLARIEEIQER